MRKAGNATVRIPSVNICCYLVPTNGDYIPCNKPAGPEYGVCAEHRSLYE